MAQESTFRGTLIFLDRLGVYDVILPFLLVFTIVFAILDKTRVLGTEVIEGEKVAKKNLNAMTAFVISFLTVASSQLVAIINQTAGHVVILLLISIMFLLLVGSFMEESDTPVYLQKPWSTLFMGIMFIGLAFIFLNAIENENGKTWLNYLYDQVMNFNNSTAVSAIILLLIVVGFMYYVVRTPGSLSGKSNDK